MVRVDFSVVIHRILVAGPPRSLFVGASAMRPYFRNPVSSSRDVGDDDDDDDDEEEVMR